MTNCLLRMLQKSAEECGRAIWESPVTIFLFVNSFVNNFKTVS